MHWDMDMAFEAEYGDINDAVQIEVTRGKRAGAVISVRFNADELRRLRSGMNQLGETRPSRFIKEAALRDLAHRTQPAKPPGAATIGVPHDESSASLMAKPAGHAPIAGGGTQVEVSFAAF